MIMTSRTKTIHIIGASFAGQAFVDKYQSLNPDCQLIVIDKEKAPNYIPNGLNQLLRGDIGNLSEAMWQSPYQDPPSQHKFIEAEVLAIQSSSNLLILKDSQGRIFEEPYETLVCAMGATPESHYMEVQPSRRILVTKYYHDSQSSLDLIENSQKILVIGAGLIGLDLAYSLSLRGKDVVLLEAADRPDVYQTDAEMIAPIMSDMSSRQVTFIKNTRVTAIQEVDEAIVAQTEHGELFQGDLAILAINFRPNSHKCLVPWTKPFW